MNTTSVCIKVANLRKIGYTDLREWMSKENNIYVGRYGRIFINKEIFNYKGSKWGNPFKITKEMTIDQSLTKYLHYLFTSKLIFQIDELKGKILGCFCDKQKEGKKILCHAQLLSDIVNNCNHLLFTNNENNEIKKDLKNNKEDNKQLIKIMTTEFVEIKGSYPKRTVKNINESDGTIIFYVNDQTPGEKLTLKVLNELKKPYLKVKLITSTSSTKTNQFDLQPESLEQFINKYKIKKLNVAGNSISRFKTIDQVQLDLLIHNFFKNCSNIKSLELIQSGCQTGSDESAIKAGIKLGIKTLGNVPEKWMFRDKNGNDICDKELFIKRFVNDI